MTFISLKLYLFQGDLFDDKDKGFVVVGVQVCRLNCRFLLLADSFALDKDVNTYFCVTTVKRTVFKSRRVAEKVLKEVCVVTRRYIKHGIKPNWTWIVEEILPIIIGCVLRNAGSVPNSKKCRNNLYYIT